MTTDVFQTPKLGDQFTDVNGETFTVTNLFEVQSDAWIEYQNHMRQPFYCRTEAFLARFRPITNS
jgi:hypothetical protein